MTDKPNQIKNKINRHGFSGGQETEEEHRKLGGNPDVDVSYQYLRFLLDDDEELDRLAKVCAAFMMSRLALISVIGVPRRYLAYRPTKGQVYSDLAEIRV